MLPRVRPPHTHTHTHHPAHTRTHTHHPAHTRIHTPRRWKPLPSARASPLCMASTCATTSGPPRASSRWAGPQRCAAVQSCCLAVLRSAVQCSAVQCCTVLRCAVCCAPATLLRCPKPLLGPRCCCGSACVCRLGCDPVQGTLKVAGSKPAAEGCVPPLCLSAPLHTHTLRALRQPTALDRWGPQAATALASGHQQTMASLPHSLSVMWFSAGCRLRRHRGTVDRVYITRVCVDPWLNRSLPTMPQWLCAGRAAHGPPGAHHGGPTEGEEVRRTAACGHTCWHACLHMWPRVPAIMGVAGHTAACGHTCWHACLRMWPCRHAIMGVAGRRSCGA